MKPTPPSHKKPSSGGKPVVAKKGPPAPPAGAPPMPASPLASSLPQPVAKTSYRPQWPAPKPQ